MNIYRTVIDHLMIEPFSAHGENAWLLGLLQVGALLNVTGTGNPFKAVVSDLKDRNIAPAVVERVAQLLNTESEKWESR